MRLCAAGKRLRDWGWQSKLCHDQTSFSGSLFFPLMRRRGWVSPRECTKDARMSVTMWRLRDGKRQTPKMKLLPSLFSCVYSRVKLFVFAINSRRRYSIFVCFIYGLEENNSKSEVIFCRLPLTSCLTSLLSSYARRVRVVDKELAKPRLERYYLLTVKSRKKGARCLIVKKRKAKRSGAMFRV